MSTYLPPPRGSVLHQTDKWSGGNLMTHHGRCSSCRFAGHKAFRSDRCEGRLWKWRQRCSFLKMKRREVVFLTAWASCHFDLWMFCRQDKLTGEERGLGRVSGAIYRPLLEEAWTMSQCWYEIRLLFNICLKQDLFNSWGWFICKTLVGHLKGLNSLLNNVNGLMFKRTVVPQ